MKPSQFDDALRLLRSLKPHVSGNLGPTIDLLERLSAGHVSSKGMQGILEQLGLFGEISEITTRNPLAVQRTNVFFDQLSKDMVMVSFAERQYKFWSEYWTSKLGKEVTVKPFPDLSSEQFRKLHKYGFIFMYIPELPEEDFPESFKGVNWKKWDDCSSLSIPYRLESLERFPFDDGYWIAIETIKEEAFGLDDRENIVHRVGFESRLISDELLEKSCLPAVHSFLSDNMWKVGLPNIEEWNLVANVFPDIQEFYPDKMLPDFRLFETGERVGNKVVLSNNSDSKPGMLIGSGFGAETGIDRISLMWKTKKQNSVWGFRVVVVFK